MHRPPPSLLPFLSDIFPSPPALTRPRPQGSGSDTAPPPPLPPLTGRAERAPPGAGGQRGGAGGAGFRPPQQPPSAGTERPQEERELQPPPPTATATMLGFCRAIPTEMVGPGAAGARRGAALGRERLRREGREGGAVRLCRVGKLCK